MRSKKGQIGTLGPAIIVLVLAGMMLILGLVMIQEFRDTDILRQANSYTITNETLATVTEAGEQVAEITQPAFNTFVVTIIQNATGGETIDANNYTVTASTGTIAATATSEYNNTNWNISYTFLGGDVAFVSANTSLVGLSTFADFWEILVLAVVISIVIGLLLVVFGSRRNR